LKLVTLPAATLIAVANAFVTLDRARAGDDAGGCGKLQTPLKDSMAKTALVMRLQAKI